MINQLKTTLLLGLLTGLVLVIGYYFGGSSGLTIALVFSVLMNFGAYFFSDKIVLLMYRAKEADTKKYKFLYHMVKNIAKKANLPMPKVYIVPNNIANAFATGRNPKHASIAFTQGILGLLNKEELEGVAAHELSHVKNRDILISTIAATIAGVISYLAFMARMTVFFGRNDRNSGNIIGLLVMAILAPIIAMIIQLAISRSREYLADESGARTLKNSKGLADALRKLELGAKHNPLRNGNEATAHMFIVNPFSARGIMHLLSTHPLTSERIQRLESIKF